PAFLLLPRPVQFVVRLLDVLAPPRPFPCRRGTLPHGLVRGVAGHADAGPIRHSNCRDPAAQPTEPCPDVDSTRRGGSGSGPAVYSAGRPAWTRAAAQGPPCPRGHWGGRVWGVSRRRQA